MTMMYKANETPFSCDDTVKFTLKFDQNRIASTHQLGSTRSLLWIRACTTVARPSTSADFFFFFASDLLQFYIADSSTARFAFGILTDNKPVRVKADGVPRIFYKSELFSFFVSKIIFVQGTSAIQGESEGFDDFPRNSVGKPSNHAYPV
ncbi:Hypothetical protein CINCED_3A000401 [Cinara cedri]|uniref:Uncharacterized protein n=1 Tax=Cinara cedri TaxID=506608 RepID=A0A5E4MZN0_9HEMI|nr:Hypothetical protein CINCED_3A000401 [Cinara cedri]